MKHAIILKKRCEHLNNKIRVTEKELFISEIQSERNVHKQQFDKTTVLMRIKTLAHSMRRYSVPELSP